MSAIKRCPNCEGLYTGSTSLCAGCYFSALPAPRAAPSELALSTPISRSKRRALERAAQQELLRAQRTSAIASQRRYPSSKVVKNRNEGAVLAPRDSSPCKVRVGRDCDSPREEKARTKIAQVRVAKSSVAPETCRVCNKLVAQTELIGHLLKVHELDPYGKPLSEGKRHVWVSVVSGGLPSLGKRR